MHGRLIERKDHLPLIQTIKFGNAYKPGMYILEIIKGSLRKQLKLIKVTY
jgi:hypothetical protein